MVKENKKSTGKSLRAVGFGTAVAGAGLVIVSSIALASPPYQQQTTPPAQTQAKDQYSQLPEGQGKATLVRVCSKCHSPIIVVANGQTRDGWEDTITKMAGIGATASDEEFTEILDYLVKNFPPTSKVNINKATLSELQAQLGFTSQQAQSIVDYRQKNGDFKTLDDLKKVPQMDTREIDTRRSRIVFQ